MEGNEKTRRPELFFVSQSAFAELEDKVHMVALVEVSDQFDLKESSAQNPLTFVSDMAVGQK